MDSIVRAAAIYLALFGLFRVSGKRSLSQSTTFDFVLLLIISEAVSSALLANDASITGALLSVVTLMVLDLMLSLARVRWPWLDRRMQDAPVWLIRQGRCDTHAMRMERVDEQDILEVARLNQGLTSLDQIEAALMESNGKISIIPAALPAAHPAARG